MPHSKCSPTSQSKHWSQLQTLQSALSEQTIVELFSEEPERVNTFSCQGAGLSFDYSRNLLSKEVRDALLALLEENGLAEAIVDMFSGEAINNTENRAVLHVALRSPMKELPEEIEVHQALDKMEGFVNSVHTGSWQGYTGKGITDVVNIGIGGSDLGPAMAYEALTPFHVDGITCHFVSNVDPAHINQTLELLNPEHTLFVIASKTFTTLETLQNAETARRWFLSLVPDDSALPRHFVAVSSNIEKARAFGIGEDNIFPMWDWVGGRYSLWSAIGLPIALGVGMDNFRAMLAGAHEMDEHFRTADFEHNIPVLMAILTFWYQQFWGAQTQTILPYIQNLHLFPAFLQQLDMESLGKSVRKDGTALDIPSGGIVWGSAGTNGQHSFHQLLHQGTHLIPADFILAAKSHYNQNQHEHLTANGIAQCQALMWGKTLDQAKTELEAQGMNEETVNSLSPHKVIQGNRPSSTLMMPALTPETLGALTAAYEQKVFVLSVLLQINAFDQWGVELGKVLSSGIHKSLVGEEAAEFNGSEVDSSTFDKSTQAMIDYCKNNRA